MKLYKNGNGCHAHIHTYIYTRSYINSYIYIDMQTYTHTLIHILRGKNNLNLKLFPVVLLEELDVFYFNGIGTSL